MGLEAEINPGLETVPIPETELGGCPGLGMWEMLRARLTVDHCSIRTLGITCWTQRVEIWEYWSFQRVWAQEWRF